MDQMHVRGVQRGSKRGADQIQGIWAPGNAAIVVVGNDPNDATGALVETVSGKQPAVMRPKPWVKQFDGECSEGTRFDVRRGWRYEAPDEVGSAQGLAWIGPFGNRLVVRFEPKGYRGHPAV